MASHTILSNFFENQCTQNHPQFLLVLLRALFPTTILEIAVYASSCEGLGKNTVGDMGQVGFPFWASGLFTLLAQWAVFQTPKLIQ